MRDNTINIGSEMNLKYYQLIEIEGTVYKNDLGDILLRSEDGQIFKLQGSTTNSMIGKITKVTGLPIYVEESKNELIVHKYSI